MADRPVLIPAAYIFLEKDGKFLLMRRANTGYEDGNYQNPSGHVEAGETPSETAIRETKEEVGVTIAPQDLEFVHTAVRLNKERTCFRIAFFFRAKKWKGEIQNMEPEKCDDLLWVSPDDLPSNTVSLIRNVLTSIQKGETFSEVFAS